MDLFFVQLHTIYIVIILRFQEDHFKMFNEVKRIWQILSLISKSNNLKKNNEMPKQFIKVETLSVIKCYVNVVDLKVPVFNKK